MITPQKNTLPEIIKKPLLILRKKEVLAVLKKHWIANHENLLQPEDFVEEFFSYLEDASKQENISEGEIKKVYNKKLKEYWDESLRLQKPKDMFLEMLEGELKGVKTILDFGCGKMAFLKEIAQNDGNIEELIGIDALSHPALEGLDPRIRFRNNLDEIEGSSVDLAVVKLVLHHLNDIHEATDVFNNLAMVLKPGGKLVIFEESFPDEKYGISETEKYLAKFNMEMSEVTADFLKLSQEDKIEFLLLNDWLMNLQNPYMPWTGLYGTMEEWKMLVESVGLKEREAHFLGAIKHRKRKQGMTAMLVFEK